MADKNDVPPPPPPSQIPHSYPETVPVPDYSPNPFAGTERK